MTPPVLWALVVGVAAGFAFGVAVIRVALAPVLDELRGIRRSIDLERIAGLEREVSS